MALLIDPMPAISETARWGRRLLDLVLPPRCPACAEETARPTALCATCWAALTFLDAPWCRICGLPFELDPGPDTVCATCARARPPYDRARAVLLYDAPSKELILPFKHADRTDLAPTLAGLMAGPCAESLADVDLLVPVPLHRGRLFRRRYNQAALLALALGRRAGVPVRCDVLLRRRATRSQGQFGPAGRRRNLAGAFETPTARRASVAGRRIGLIDDVLTTGATAASCARVLRRAGAAHIAVMTLARVVR